MQAPVLVLSKLLLLPVPARVCRSHHRTVLFYAWSGHLARFTPDAATFWPACYSRLWLWFRLKTVPRQADFRYIWCPFRVKNSEIL